MRLALFLMHLFLLFLLQLFAWAAVWVTRHAVENPRDDSSKGASDSQNETCPQAQRGEGDSHV